MSNLGSAAIKTDSNGNSILDRSLLRSSSRTIKISSEPKITEDSCQELAFTALAIVSVRSSGVIPFVSAGLNQDRISIIARIFGEITGDCFQFEA
jgi:hypothetical protein